MNTVNISNNLPEKKPNFLNLAKGLAIFLMLWGHCIQYCIPNNIDFFENVGFKIIYSFHMPFFMIISGYLFYFSFQKRELKQLLTYKTQGMLHAILGGTIFIYITYDYILMLRSGSAFAIFNGNALNSINTLWFLWSVFSASLTVGFIFKKFNKLWIQLFMLMLGMIFVMLFPCGQQNVFMYPYYVLGFLFAKYKDSISPKVLNLKYLSIPIYIFLMFFFKKKHYIYTSGLFGNGHSIKEAFLIDLYRYVVGLFGVIAVFVCLEVFYKFVICKTCSLSFWQTLERFGSKSLQIYVVSVSLLSGYLPLLYNLTKNIFPSLDIFLASHILFYNCVFTVCIALAYSAILYFIIKLFEKIKLSKIIFGR